MKIKRHSTRSALFSISGSALTPQQQADSAQALLYIQDLVDAGLATVAGEINPARCREVLASLKQQGVEPIEDCAVRLSKALSTQLGVRLTTRGQA